MKQELINLTDHPSDLVANWAMSLLWKKNKTWHFCLSFDGLAISDECGNEFYLCDCGHPKPDNIKTPDFAEFDESFF